MQKDRRYDIIFILILSGLILILNETQYSWLVQKYGLIFMILSYFIGKGIGKGIKEKEWKEKTEETKTESNL
ncbi:MAG: hypothetical protein R6U04_07870 [Bacteroidales bacterium]